MIMMGMRQQQSHGAQIVLFNEIEESASLVLVINSAIDDHRLTRVGIIEDVGTFLTLVNLKLFNLDVI